MSKEKRRRVKVKNDLRNGLKIKDMEVFVYLALELDVGSVKEIFCFGLNALEWIVEQESQGHRIFAIDQDGKIVEEVGCKE